MVNLIGIKVAVERMIERGGDPLAVAGVLGRSPLLADHPNVGHSARQRPGQLDFMVVKLDPHVLDVGQENERAERDRA